MTGAHRNEHDADAVALVRVRRAVSGDEQTLRELRLRAVTVDPDAFGSTYDREVARTAEQWSSWLAPHATFIALRDQAPCGLAAGLLDPEASTALRVAAMWVAPEARAAGAGDALLRAVLGWGVDVGMVTADLLVVEGNEPAIRLYRRHGFEFNGTEEVRDRDGARELVMTVALPEWASPSPQEPLL